DLRATHADDSLYWLEKIALRRNRENDALAFARELLQMYPGSPFAPRSLYAIAEVREEKGALGPALGLFREAGARFPETEYGQRALWAVGWVQYQARQWGAARDEWLRIARGSSGEVAPRPTTGRPAPPMPSAASNRPERRTARGPRTTPTPTKGNPP